MAGLWEYRGLIKKIAVTDMKIRYKNSVLGFMWSLLQPLAMMAVLYIVFTNVFKNGDIKAYPLYLMIGIVSWGFFDKATGFSLNSIVGKAGLIKKIYFPREVLVISACLTALMMSLIEFIVVAVFMIFFIIFPQTINNYLLSPTPLVLLFPVVLLIEFVLALGVSLAIAALNVRYRDIQWIWGVVMQVGFFLTPIMYSLSIFNSSGIEGIIQLNPVGVLMELTRNVLINERMPQLQDFFTSFGGDVAYVLFISAVVMAVGWFIFKRLEPDFSEEV